MDITQRLSEKERSGLSDAAIGMLRTADEHKTGILLIKNDQAVYSLEPTRAVNIRRENVALPNGFESFDELFVFACLSIDAGVRTHALGENGEHGFVAAIDAGVKGSFEITPASVEAINRMCDILGMSLKHNTLPHFLFSAQIWKS